MDSKSMIKIGIDLDNTITGSDISKQFFKLMTHLLYPDHEIHIISNREKDMLDETIQELNDHEIQYHHLSLTGDKADYIITHNISVVFEDTDEYFQMLPESVLVFKIREEGNFNFKSHKWIGSQKTVDLIDE